VNYLTSAAAEMLAQTSCIEQIVLGRPGELLQSVPGYPGLYMLQVAGHTPGSQIFIAHLRRGMGRQTLVFAGDIANHIDGVRHNISKPPFYSRFVVPENLQQLEKTRRWLQALDQRPGVTVLLSHDLPALRASGVPEIR
ncbi:MAG: hypothetical protein KDI36_13960, partial [Pseudomonadales bacterium]|nr:hypothetical protein [Pseudomonadales bacterium]